MSHGFLAMSGVIPFPPLGSTAGLGGLNTKLIPFPPLPELFQEGTGLNTLLRAQTFDGPKTTIRYPELDLSKPEEGTTISASSAPAPRLSGEGPAVEEESAGTNIKATVHRSPRVIIRKG